MRTWITESYRIKHPTLQFTTTC